MLVYQLARGLVFVFSAVLRADASASSIQWAMKEQFSSSECTMNNLTEHTVLGRIGTVAMGLGCGGANGNINKHYVVEGTELIEYTHVFNIAAECSDTALSNTTWTLDQCVESSTGVYEKVKLVTAPGMLDVPYDVGDENCSGAPLSKYLSPMLCVASNVVDGYLSRMPTCQGEQRISCYYSNSDCTGSQMCGGSATDLNKCYASGGGRYAISSILGSDDEVAELCTTTTTTAFAGISGTISIYTDGGCSVLGSTEPINLGPCTLTGSTSSIDFTCMEGSIAYNAYSTDDCSGEATTQVLEQGPCIPMDNGTSSWIVAFPGCTGLQAGHKHLAVVRVFSTEEELQLLMDSVEKWDKAGAIPCTTKSSMSEIDLILVYSKDLEADAEAKSIVGSIEAAFHSDVYGWMSCFSNIKSMSANLNPEQDVYDNRGYTTNKHWVSGPNAVFSKIMMAMMEGEFNDTYDIFFLMEMDAVPIKDHWLDQFEMEAHEMADNGMAIRGSQYLGDKWDLFKSVMPTYLVEHINGNAMYNLKHPWTKAVYDAFHSMDGGSMMEEMAFDVAFAMITMDAMSGNTSQFAAAWAAAGGNNQTYNWDSMLVGNYANTLLNTSFEFPTYIRHGSSKNLFANLDDEHVTLGVAVFDHQGHLKDTIPTHHPFKKILALTYYPHPQQMDMYEAPVGNVTMTTQAATGDPFYHLCETARLVDTKWFALTDNYHIIKAPVSVLMDMGDKPVLPYVLRNSKYCGERPNCEASMLQAEGLFSITLNYHHDKYEVLYKTDDARMFCDAWDLATGSTASESWANCSLSFGPTGDDYIAWKISVDQNITEEFTPKDKTRYGWRAWTSLWNPAPVDSRECTPMLYGPKEYLETLGNISHCAVDYVENAAACESDTTCAWKAMFESGVCFQDPKISVTTTTTMAGVTYSTIEVTLPLTVDDAAAILNNATVQDAMKQGFATAMEVPVEDVMLEIQAARRLSSHTRKLQTELLAVFTVIMPSLEDAIVKQVEIETLSLEATNEAIASAVASTGFSGALEVTGKTTMRVAGPTTTTTTTTTTQAGNTTTTEGGDDGDAGDDGDDGDDGDEQPPSSAIAGSASAAVLGLAVALLA